MRSTMYANLLDTSCTQNRGRMYLGVNVLEHAAEETKLERI